MGHERPDSELDADLNRIVSSSGRVPTRGAVAGLVGAALIFLIDRLSGGVPTTLGYLAAAVVVAVTAPGLLAVALADRRRSLEWALEEQRRRARAAIEAQDAAEHREEMQRRVAALEDGARRRRDAARSTATGRRAALRGDAEEGDS